MTTSNRTPTPKQGRQADAARRRLAKSFRALQRTMRRRPPAGSQWDIKGVGPV